MARRTPGPPTGTSSVAVAGAARAARPVVGQGREPTSADRGASRPRVAAAGEIRPAAGATPGGDL